MNGLGDGESDVGRGGMAAVAIVNDEVKGERVWSVSLDLVQDLTARMIRPT